MTLLSPHFLAATLMSKSKESPARDASPTRKVFDDTPYEIKVTLHRKPANAADIERVLRANADQPICSFCNKMAFVASSRLWLSVYKCSGRCGKAKCEACPDTFAACRRCGFWGCKECSEMGGHNPDSAVPCRRRR